jgi:hypothetical protein
MLLKNGLAKIGEQTGQIVYSASGFTEGKNGSGSAQKN